MQVLFESIYSKFTGSTGADSLHALLGGKLHPVEAPQDSAYPYGVYRLISDVPEYIFDTTTVIENVLIQFNIFDDDNSATDINSAYSALTTLYDWCSLSITGYSSVCMKRELNFLTRENDIWNYMIEYRVIFQKN